MERSKHTFMDDPRGLGLYQQLEGEHHYVPLPTKEQIAETVKIVFDHIEANPNGILARMASDLPEWLDQQKANGIY